MRCAAMMGWGEVCGNKGDGVRCAAMRGVG
jgi:hypothetical protein